MTSEQSRAIQPVRSLAPELRLEVDALAEVCRRHDGLEVPLHGEPAGDAPESQLFLSYHRGAVIGFASAQPGRPVEVLGIVHPEHRREGIGRALLAAVAEEYRGAGDLLLVCEEASTSGRAFAAAVGGAYRFSEHRMQLNRDAFEKREMGHAPIRVVRAGPDDLEALVSIRNGGVRR